MAVTNEALERRFHELEKQSRVYAAAKAQMTYLAEFRKSQLAILMKKYAARGVETAVAQDREARADPEYLQVLEGLKDATEIAERERWALRIAEMGFEGWRTLEATKRAEAKL